MDGFGAGARGRAFIVAVLLTSLGVAPLACSGRTLRRDERLTLKRGEGLFVLAVETTNPVTLNLCRDDVECVNLGPFTRDQPLSVAVVQMGRHCLERAEVLSSSASGFVRVFDDDMLRCFDVGGGALNYPGHLVVESRARGNLAWSQTRFRWLRRDTAVREQIDATYAGLMDVPLESIDPEPARLDDELQQALAHFERAGPTDEPCTDGALCLRLGRHRNKTGAHKAALRLFTHGCKLRSAESCAHHAHLLTSNALIPPDEKTALALYLKACDLDPAVGCAQAAKLVAQGRGAASDAKRAEDLAVRGCRDGRDTRACAVVASLAEKAGRVDEATAILRSLCNLNVGTACVRLALRTRERGDEVAALALEQKAVPLLDDECHRARQSSACAHLADVHRRGLAVAASPALAKALQDRACRLHRIHCVDATKPARGPVDGADPVDGW